MADSFIFSHFRFEIEKKLRQAKKKEQKRSKKKSSSGDAAPSKTTGQPKSASERSQERRKVMEDRKDNKKFSALQDLKARREEKIRKGMYGVHAKSQ